MHVHERVYMHMCMYMSVCVYALYVYARVLYAHVYAETDDMSPTILAPFRMFY